ncbi:MAG: bile acid:sodium symporter [Novosphingobium sp.]|nr:bile acid:sodium symporter [Novosphingobium sp.]
MRKRIAWMFDPFLIALLLAVVLASLWPPRGAFAPVAQGAADAGIVLLFFLHGAKLSREAIWDGARNCKLHGSVLAITFAAFPLLGLAIVALPLGLGPLATGFLFLTLLPSTVQSSIAFTAIARGNVAAAVCSATFSNLAGIALTPLLVAVLISGAAGSNGGVSTDAVRAIVLQLLVPFALGHALRPLIGAFVSRHKQMLSLVDRGSILLVVYVSFGAAVVEGLWRRVSIEQIGIITLLSCVLLAIVLGLTALTGRMLGLPREDRIVLQFCGSKKSLATGVPMAGVLFPATQVGVMILPLMIFHQIQLVVCAVLARHYAEEGVRAEKGVRPPGEPASPAAD